MLHGFAGGAVASIFLFLPWLMLAANLLRWRSADGITEKSYGLVIILWLVFPIAAFSIIGGYFVLAGIVLSLGFGGGTASLSMMFGVLGASGVIVEIVVWNRLRRWASDLSGESDQYLPSDALSLPWTHLAPFAGAWLASVIAPAYLVTCIYVVLQTA